MDCLPKKENLSVYEGDDCTFDLASEIGDISGAKIELQARVSTASRYAIISVTGVLKDGPTGAYQITIPSAASIGKSSTTPYHYDIKITLPSGQIHTDRTGYMLIESRTTDIQQIIEKPVFGVDVDANDASVLKKAENLNFKGSGVKVTPNANSGVDIEIEQPKPARFSGIYNTLKDLQDAIPAPDDNQQAIVLTPSESYYHVASGVWAELAPVGSIHAGYIGAYDTLSDLNIAVPAPKENSLAIIGGASFYYFVGGKWVALSHDDIDALGARVTKNEADISDVSNKAAKNESNIGTIEPRVTKNEADIKSLMEKDGQAITHVSLDGTVITFTHADGAKHAVQLPKPSAAPSGPPASLVAQIKDLEAKMAQTGTDVSALKQSLGELKHRLDELQSVFSYRGAAAPTYPTEPKGAYFVNFSGSTGNTVALPLPDQDLPDGTTYFVNNENAKTQIAVTPKSGESIEQATSITVPAQSVLMLVKSGSNWVRNYAGYIPSALQDLINRVSQQLTPELHTTDQITAMINQWLANPATHGTLDQIMASLGYEKKTQPQPHPDSIQVYIGKSDNYPTAFTRANGPFAPHQKLVAQGMDVTPSKVWIAVPKVSASKVTGIVANGGLPAIWDSQDVNTNGKDWTVYLSPYQFHSQHIDFTLNWSI